MWKITTRKQENICSCMCHSNCPLGCFCFPKMESHMNLYIFNSEAWYDNFRQKNDLILVWSFNMHHYIILFYAENFVKCQRWEHVTIFTKMIFVTFVVKRCYSSKLPFPLVLRHFGRLPGGRNCKILEVGVGGCVYIHKSFEITKRVNIAEIYMHPFLPTEKSVTVWKK